MIDILSFSFCQTKRAIIETALLKVFIATIFYKICANARFTLHFCGFVFLFFTLDLVREE